MKEMRLRFDEIVKYERKEKMFECNFCPCYKECKNLPEEYYSYKDKYFTYKKIRKNFDLQKEKILKTLDR